MYLTTDICSEISNNRPKASAVDIRLKYIEKLSDEYFRLLFEPNHLTEVSVKSVNINRSQFYPHPICYMILA